MSRGGKCKKRKGGGGRKRGGMERDTTEEEDRRSGMGVEGKREGRGYRS